MLGGDLADVRFVHAAPAGGFGQQLVLLRQRHGGLHPAVKDVGVLELVVAFRIFGDRAGEREGGVPAVSVLGEFERKQAAHDPRRKYHQDEFWPVSPEIPGNL